MPLAQTQTLLDLKSHKITFKKFIASLRETGLVDDPAFLAWFTVQDVLLLRQVSKECSQVLSESTILNLIRLGNLNDHIRINFWVQ